MHDMRSLHLHPLGGNVNRVQLGDVQRTPTLDLLYCVAERGRRDVIQQERADLGKNVGLKALEYLMGMAPVPSGHPVSMPLARHISQTGTSLKSGAYRSKG